MRGMLLLGALLLIGCHGDPDTACDVVMGSAHTCTEFDGVSDEGLTQLNEFCLLSHPDPTKTARVVTSCQTTDILGTCSGHDADAIVSSVEFFYGRAGATDKLISGARESCEGRGGVWERSP